MTHSSFVVDESLLERAAIYYRADGRRREPYHLPGAAGALYSTASDMARYLLLYMEDGRQILPAERFAAMLTPAFDVSGETGVGYALGHYVVDTPEARRVVFHSGGNPGLRALYLVAPELQAGFFAVANNDKGDRVLARLMRTWANTMTSHSRHTGSEYEWHSL